jgi:hypothetical protein
MDRIQSGIKAALADPTEQGFSCGREPASCKPELDGNWPHGADALPQ